MKIVSVDIIDVKNPLQSAVAKWRPVVVRINTDEGVSGFGEVGMAYGVGASAGFGMAKDLARLLIGEDPMRSEYIWDKMQKKTFWGQGGGTVVSAGMSAIDIALWDIKGKVLGVPCYQLFGGKCRDELRTYASQLQFGLMHAQMVSDELMTNSGAEGMVVANHSDGLLSYSRLRHMTIQAWSPFQSGTEYGPFVGNEHFPELNKALDEKGAKYGVSANAIATAWVLRHPAKIQIVLGSMNPTRLGEMLDGADIDLDKQDWWDLYVAAGNLIP